MLDAKKFSIAGMSFAAFFSIVGSSTTIAGCVADEVSGGAPASHDVLGGMGGMPLYAGGGAMNGVGGDPVPEAAGKDGGTSHLATTDATKDGGPSHLTTNATRGAESPSPADITSLTGQGSSITDKRDSVQQGFGTEAGGAECVTSDGAPYVAKSC